jgi:hypothetical protein
MKELILMRQKVEPLLTYGPKVLYAVFFLYLGLHIINWLAKTFH